ncbi:uncharacterized protein SPAPADRAFT_131559, partial [Spathaspora passalidarum NRRL Y-27907]
IVMASNGHFLTQIPQPIHKVSEMKAILDAGVTSIHNFPVLTTGQLFLHSCLHFFGLHSSVETIAILSFLESVSPFVLFFARALILICLLSSDYCLSVG